MHIQVVGHYDHDSRRLQRVTREVAEELHLDANVEFTDVDTVPAALYDAVPALVVDGQVKASGCVPSRNVIGSLLHPRPD